MKKIEIDRARQGGILLRWAALFVGFTVWVGTCYAFKLSPEATKIERMEAASYDNRWLTTHLAKSGLYFFAKPVHEEIVQRAYLCDADIDDGGKCVDLQQEYAGPYVVAGARWNDDPPFRLSQREAAKLGCDTRYTIRFTTQVLCWTKLFKLGEGRAGRGRTLGPKNASLMWRSHLGDLQFLHAMASKDGESATVTRDSVLMWLELMWKIGSGDVRNSQLLRELKIQGMSKYFGTSGWTIQDLLTLGIPALRAHMAEVAFGSMAHVISDSFAGGHVTRAAPAVGRTCGGALGYRAPGLIKEFHAYNRQDHNKHGDADTRDAFVEHVKSYRVAFTNPRIPEDEIPHVVNIVKNLKVLLFEQRAKWDEVKPYLSCVFDVEDPSRAASPGAAFSIVQ